MRRSEFISCKERTAVHSEGGQGAGGGQGIEGDSLYFPFSFSLNVKLLLKMKFINLKTWTE